MLLIAFIAALAAQELGVHATPAPPPAEEAPIRWTRSPGLEMPGKALQANVSGSATLRCDFAAGTPTKATRCRRNAAPARANSPSDRWANSRRRRRGKSSN